MTSVLSPMTASAQQREENRAVIYKLTVYDKETDEFISQEIISLDGVSSILTEESVESGLDSRYELIEFAISGDDGIATVAVETLYDVACLVISIEEFKSNPSVWSGMAVVMDSVSVTFPFIPSVTNAPRLVNMIKSGDTLQDSLKYGIKPYKELRKNSSLLYHAHHIMPKTFDKEFNISSKENMFCIRIPADIHNKITGKFNSNDYGLNDKNKTYSREFIRQQTMKIYMDLYNETGDNVYEYMYLFIKENKNYEPK